MTPPRLSRLLRPLRALSQSAPTTIPRQTPTIIKTRTFQTGPAPPRLPPDQQAEFERLQRTANTQQGFNATAMPDFSSPSPSTSTQKSQSEPQAQASSNANANTVAESSLSTPLRKGAPPEFVGDVNPRTGEVGGPKNEPLRWGASGDYSYNGRVTDF
ncbi:hypothetical protein GGR50DRAFT_665122 [Xylaria sp. CBS 124048]|nr:hypothetical protein GGR50DRAFT_665122 [Xylaria sp. CBS 124048]